MRALCSKDRSPALQRNRIIVYLLMSMLNMQGLPLHTVRINGQQKEQLAGIKCEFCAPLGTDKREA